MSNSMLKTFGIMLGTAAATIVALSAIFGYPKSDKIIGKWRPPHEDVVEMPIVQDSHPERAYFQSGLQEDRGSEYRNYLSPSVKIRSGGSGGSGTIIDYEPSTGEAYVISCGHLWRGAGSSSEARGKTAEITVWYKNQVKLPKPETFSAKVLFWNNDRGYDCSLLVFHPDWEPDFFPIAPIDYQYTPGMSLHSVGCDGSREVAHYHVEFLEFRGLDLVTRRNSPRPGRSGGGLISNDGYFVGICWGTSDTTSGSGVGYFTPIKSIHTVFTKNNYGWLLEVSAGLARRVPIRDRLNPNKQWDQKYIPLPSHQRTPIPKLAILN